MAIPNISGAIKTATSGAGTAQAMGSLRAGMSDVMAGVGIFSQVGGMIASAIGSSQSGRTAKLNYQMQAQSDQLNARLSQINAARSGLNARSLLLNAEASRFNATVMRNNAAMARKFGEFNASNAEFNARLFEFGAQQELQKGAAEVARLTLQAGAMKSTQRAAMAANGIDLGEGSAAEVQASTDIMKDIDKNTLTANAIRSAFGYRQQATNAQLEAYSARMQAESQAMSYESSAFDSNMKAMGFESGARDATLNALADEMKSGNYGMQASASRNAASSIRPGAMASASLMTGAASVADSWYRYSKGKGSTYTITT